MKKTPEEIVLMIQEACKDLGWHIAMDESQDKIRGLVIGQFEFVEEIVEQLNDMDNYTIYSNAEETDTEFH